jgi:diaminopimelate epimerase
LWFEWLTRLWQFLLKRVIDMALQLIENTNIEFVKMHGLGNDFIIVFDEEGKFKEISNYARQLCDRRFGIGADGLVLCIKRPDGYHIRIYNSDGSEAQVCGNALRCVAHYLYSHDIATTDLVLHTKAGVKEITPVGSRSYRVNMGEPIWRSELVPVKCDSVDCLNQPINVDGSEFRIHAVSMGNPHCVLFVSDQTQLNIITRLGPVIEKHPMFPQGTNVEMVRIENEHKLRVQVWERGAGQTLACGTGACASAVVSIRLGFCTSPVTVQLPGGHLKIEWEGKGPVFMTGPANEVITGRITKENLRTLVSGGY